MPTGLPAIFRMLLRIDLLIQQLRLPSFLLMPFNISFKLGVPWVEVEISPNVSD